MHVTTTRDSYHADETVTFVVTIQNYSAWPIGADYLPPGIVIQTRDRSRFWLQASKAEVNSLIIPALETVTLEFPWQPGGGSAYTLPPGEYTATLTWIPINGYRQELRTNQFIVMEE
jgi:hypothetical protein